MKPFTLHLQAFLVPSVGPHKLIQPVIPNLSGLVVGRASSPDSHRKRVSHRASHLGILRSPAQGPLRWPLCLPRPHLMCWGCGCPQTLGPEAWGLGGWVPHFASGPWARPEKGRNTGEEGTPKHEAPYDTAWLQRMKWTGNRSTMGRGRKPFPKKGERGIGAGKSLTSPKAGHTHAPVLFPFPVAVLTMGVLGSPSSCRDGQRKGSEEPPAALALGKVQFLAS